MIRIWVLSIPNSSIVITCGGTHHNSINGLDVEGWVKTHYYVK